MAAPGFADADRPAGAAERPAAPAPAAGAGPGRARRQRAGDGRGAAGGVSGGARRRAHRRDLPRLARRRTHPGRSRVAARRRVRALHRGQRADRRAAHQRPAPRHRSGGGAPATLLSLPSHRDRPRLPASRVRHSRPPAGAGHALRPRPQPGVAPRHLRRRGARPAGVLAHREPGHRRAAPRLHRLRVGHPLPGRPVPEDYRALVGGASS